MPDYSGYAQRPQQDPNLAAWAQIGGNIANIFGLDPAKAAEARRGLQQEDYNEQRNQAYIRQQLANKRIGELFAGPGFDPARSEFTDPAAWQEFARLMGELGSGHQAPAYGPGHLQSQLDARIEAENRLYAKRQEAEDKRQAGYTARDAERRAAARQEGLAKEWEARKKFGGRNLEFGASQGIDDFNAIFDTGDATKGVGMAPRNRSELFEPTPETRSLPAEKQVLVPTKQFQEWLDKAGYKARLVDKAARSRMLGKDFENEKGKVQSAVARKLQLPVDHPSVTDLTERIYASQLNQQAAERSIPSVSSQAEIAQIIESATANPENAPETMIVRFPVINREDGTISYRYDTYSVAEVAKMKRDNPKHPINILQKGG